MPRHSLIPRPQCPPATLLTLYRHYTKDYKAPKELVHTLVRQDSDQRLLVVSLRMKGYSYAQISGAMGVSARNVLYLCEKTMLRAWRVINRVPRYYKVGRKSSSKVGTDLVK